MFQPKYWEHAIRDENDLERHADYIHYNPVRHAVARCPEDWPYSTFQRFVRSGDYPAGWGCSDAIRASYDFTFADLETSAME